MLQWKPPSVAAAAPAPAVPAASGAAGATISAADQAAIDAAMADAAPIAAAGAPAAPKVPVAAGANDARLKVDQNLLTMLLEFGFTRVRAEKALVLTQNKTVEAAMEW